MEEGKVEAAGGHFWDGRANTLALQALGPFLNKSEMNNPSAKSVVDKIAASAYANLFRQEFGASVFANADAAYTQVGVAIEAFERSDPLQSFTSKFDAVLRKQASLTPTEQRGLALFQDPTRANCAGCHLVNTASTKPEDSLFSEFTYYATGIPRNGAIPANADANFFDLGLCGPNRSKPVLPASVPVGVTAENFCGMFRMPTLRNVAERPAYMHNGFFKDLREVVRFYSTRASSPAIWYGASGLPNDLPAAYQANLEVTKAPFNRARGSGPLLTEPETGDIVAFLRTLSDGFTPTQPGPPVNPPANPPVPPRP
jgi:cytochrome c peroxidase